MSKKKLPLYKEKSSSKIEDHSVSNRSRIEMSDIGVNERTDRIMLEKPNATNGNKDMKK